GRPHRPQSHPGVVGVEVDEDALGPAVEIVLGDAIVLAIQNEQAKPSAHEEIARLVEEAFAETESAELAEENTGRIETLHAVVARVGDEEPPQVVHGDAFRISHLAGTGAVRADHALELERVG